MQELKKGDRGALVAFAQARIEALGFGPLALDGDFGPATEGAIRRLQERRGLEPSGVIDGDTWDALLCADRGADEVASFADGEPEKADLWPLEPGEAGPDVLVLQGWLSDLGFPAPDTGVMDAGTVAALARFQEAHGLPPTGAFDEDSGIVLLHALGERFPDGPGERDGAAGFEAFASAGAYRDVTGRGGYVYRQYEDGAIEIMAAPHGRGVGTGFSAGGAWQAVTAEIGPYRAAPASGPEPLAVLQRGSRGPEVEAVQARLNELGLGPITADGIFGRGTAEAVARFQQAAGLAADGRVDERTHGELCATRAPLGPGCDPTVLRRCQEALQAQGFAPGTPDGLWGSRTEGAVRRFQADRALPVTGRIDERTWGTLLGAPSVRVPEELNAGERARLLEQAREAAAGAPAVVLKVLEEAIDWLGVVEVPKGSNGGPRLDAISGGYYQPSYERVHGKPPWCALACSHWIKVGLGAATWKDVPFGQRFGAAFQYEDWAREHGRWVAATAAAPCGAVFVMARASSGSDSAGGSRAGHVGLVLRDLGDTVLTIEGNVSDKVKSNTRRKADLRGFVTWA
ncbi:MAG: peptidoglycan-binding domain-containing protein [Pseudomonadota bacterium]